jgi:hypothetical protein
MYDTIGNRIAWLVDKGNVPVRFFPLSGWGAAPAQTSNWQFSDSKEINHMKSHARYGLVCGVVLAASTMLHATSYNIDFSSLTPGTQISNQYASQDVTFALTGSPGGSGSPAIGSGVFPGGLSNSLTGAYPTSEFLDIDFASGVSNVSFTLDTYGSNPNSTFTAYSGATVVDSGGLGGFSSGFNTQDVTGSGITSIVIDNYYGGIVGPDNSWEFVVGDLSYSTTPEPGTLTLLGSGLLGLCGILRRKIAKA